MCRYIFSDEAHRVLDLVQALHLHHLADHADGGDDLPGAQLCRAPQRRLHRAQHQAQRERRAGAHHLQAAQWSGNVLSWPNADAIALSTPAQSRKPQQMTWPIRA